MKINITVEATAQEVRDFFGLPNVRPLQDEVMQALRDNMQKGVAGFDPLTLLKPLLPAQFQSLELFQKAFWEVFSKSGGPADNAPTTPAEPSAQN